MRADGLALHIAQVLIHKITPHPGLSLLFAVLVQTPRLHYNYKCAIITSFN